MSTTLLLSADMLLLYIVLYTHMRNIMSGTKPQELVIGWNVARKVGFLNYISTITVHDELVVFYP